MLKLIVPVAGILALAGCAERGGPGPRAVSPSQQIAGVAASSDTSIVRLDCGKVQVDDFSKSFSDQQIYPHQPKTLASSCYLISHNGQHLLWDTGLPAALKGTSKSSSGMTASLTTTIGEQLAQLGVSADDIDVVGISHMHFDHTGQAAAFPKARLLIGRPDYEQSAGEDDPFRPWRSAQAGNIQFVESGQADVFGDGAVQALFLPGHTPGHLALLVKLASGPVLLSGDLYHAAEARAQRGVPPFNTDRTQTLASMDEFEAIAKQRGAKVIIQHEPADVSKLPAFPEAAR